MNETIQITLPDGSVREMPAGTTGEELAASIGQSANNDLPTALLREVKEAGFSDAQIGKLTGRTIDVAGCPMTIGQAKERPLSSETTIFSRHIVCPPDSDEQAFLHWAVRSWKACP